MMNKAHNGWLRCVRTRGIGTRVLPVAHAAGVRHLAMEALFDPRLVEAANDSRHLPEVRSPSYLAQPEMRVLIQTALDLGWTLAGYEADLSLAPNGWDPMGEAFTNWREEQQAHNLVKALEDLRSDARGSRLVRERASYKDRSPEGDRTWVPMGSRFQQMSDIGPFAIDQTQTVEFGHPVPERQTRFLKSHASTLRSLGETAGFLTEEAPSPLAICGVDALLLSIDKHMEWGCHRESPATGEVESAVPGGVQSRPILRHPSFDHPRPPERQGCSPYDEVARSREDGLSAFALA